MKINTKKMILYALFAALTAVLSQIAVPLPFTPVPVNLATLSVLLAGGILGAKGGAVSQTVYVLIGAVGVPVFSNFTGGFAKLAGPTGGYIAGYIAAAWLVGFLTSNRKKNLPNLILSMAAGILLCYMLGTAWFMILTKNTLLQSLTLCVIPFLIGDALKIAAAGFFVWKLKDKISVSQSE